MIVGFTGTVDAPLGSFEIVKEAVANHREGVSGYVSGAAYGIDTIAATATLEYPEESLLVVPRGWHNKNLVESWPSLLELMPVGSDYMDRNQRMVDLSDILIAFPKTSKEELRSGTWATIRRARKKGIPVHIYPLGR